ncbi:MAG TPA: CvpA family protein [Tenuifilaceae bacterium]|nr:CvpA family protein [Tenuifilaceae bacterium]HPE17020.1 CvpA family protein [Tenuifilaceae bacterium]HPJ44695.1 CvpA family protein [Tenuifilaceae bacterium]HPQ32959.1 CvpA family protein [Tenuifilaceae bacterium]HRX66777.1 CvpA family protein [Tenuifilaceae bacterium]
MSIIDLVLIGLFLIAGFNGYKKGVIDQAATLAGLVLGIWGAIHFSDFTANFLAEQFSFTSQYMPLISFAITFVVILVGVHFIGALVEKIISLAFLGIVNSLLGVVFGVLKTALILSVILVLLGNISHRIKVIPDDFGSKSMLYGPVKRLAPAIFPYLKFEDIKKSIESKFQPTEE